MAAIVGMQPVQTVAAIASDHYTVNMSSLDAGAPNPVRVGRDAGASPSSTRASVAIGFGSPSGDTGVTRLDLNDILVRHPQATYLMRIAGDALREVGIDSGDLVLIDRALPPSHGHVVIAVVDEEFVCRQLCKQGSDIRLQATRAGCADILAREGEEFQIWGVVTQVIKSMPV
jgi:DNA polymerase V